MVNPGIVLRISQNMFEANAFHLKPLGVSFGSVFLSTRWLNVPGKKQTTAIGEITIGRYNLESKYPLGILLKGCEVAEMTVVQSTGGEETSQSHLVKECF